MGFSPPVLLIYSWRKLPRLFCSLCFSIVFYSAKKKKKKEGGENIYIKEALLSNDMPIMQLLKN